MCVIVWVGFTRSVDSLREHHTCMCVYVYIYIYIIFIKKLRLHFYRCFRFTANLNRKHRDFPHTPCLPAPWASLVAHLVKNLSAVRETWVRNWVGKITWRREWLPTAVFWPEESHGLYSLWGCKELDTTEQLSLSPLHMHIQTPPLSTSPIRATHLLWGGQGMPLYYPKSTVSLVVHSDIIHYMDLETW